MKQVVFALVVVFVGMGAAPEKKPDIRLGLSVISIDRQTAAKEKFPVRVGVRVVGVDEGAAAEEAGLRVGDLISRIDNRAMPNSETMMEWAAKAQPDKAYHFIIHRSNENGKWEKLTVSVKPAPPNDAKKKEPSFDFDNVTVDRPKRKPAKALHRFPIAGGELCISLKSPIIYLPEKGEDYLYQFLFHAYRPEDGKTQREREGFYAINATAEEITFRSDDPTALELGRDGELGVFLKVKEQGTPNIVATLAGMTCKVPVKIERLPFNVGDDAKGIIKTFGLPDEAKKYYTSWPESETHDGIFYKPEAGQGGIASEHWRYNKYPHLVIAIVASKLYRIASYDQSHTNDFVDWLSGG